MRLERKLARAIADWWELEKVEREYVGDDLVEEYVEADEEEEREVGTEDCQQGWARELERAEVGAVR